MRRGTRQWQRARRGKHKKRHNAAGGRTRTPQPRPKSIASCSGRSPKHLHHFILRTCVCGGGGGGGGPDNLKSPPCPSRDGSIVHLIQLAALAASAARSGKRQNALSCSDRSLARDTRKQPTPWRGKRLGGTPSSSLGCPDHGGINHVQSFGAGSSPRTSGERLKAELLPVILKRFARRCSTGSSTRK